MPTFLSVTYYTKHNRKDYFTRVFLSCCNRYDTFRGSFWMMDLRVIFEIPNLTQFRL